MVQVKNEEMLQEIDGSHFKGEKLGRSDESTPGVLSIPPRYRLRCCSGGVKSHLTRMQMRVDCSHGTNCAVLLLAGVYGGLELV